MECEILFRKTNIKLKVLKLNKTKMKSILLILQLCNNIWTSIDSCINSKMKTIATGILDNS